MGNSDGFPVLSNYAAALQRFETTYPYKRGRSKGKKPLGSNRRYDRSIISKDEQTGDIICSYEGTDVIRFEMGGTIVIRHGGWESISTMDFINHILYRRFSEPMVSQSANAVAPKDKWSGIHRVKGKFYFADGYGMDHRVGEALFLLPDGSIEGGVSESQMVLDKSRMAGLRKYYAEFTEYLTYYAQMNPKITAADRDENRKATYVPVALTDVRWWSDRSKKSRNTFFDDLHEVMTREASDDKYAGFLPLADAIAINSAEKHYDMNISSYVYEVRAEKAREHFYELCRYHYATNLFTRQPVEQGKVVRDEAAKYLKYGDDEALPITVETK